MAAACSGPAKVFINVIILEYVIDRSCNEKKYFFLKYDVGNEKSICFGSTTL